MTLRGALNVRRFVNPPDPSRLQLAAVQAPTMRRELWLRGHRPRYQETRAYADRPTLGALGAAEDDDPFIPDINPEEAEYVCRDAGGVWDERNGVCVFPESDPANECAARGGAWDPLQEVCIIPDGPGPTLPEGWVAPGPTRIAIAAWDTDHKPHARYRIQYGDTYVGLAKTYLDRSGVRWPEIWNLNRTQHPNPDQIYTGQTINMPDEARDNFRRWLNKGQPGTLPSEDPRGEEGSSSAVWWVLGGGAALAGGIYAWKRWGRRR